MQGSGRSESKSGVTSSQGYRELFIITGIPGVIHPEVALCAFMKAITPTKLSVSSIPRPNSSRVGGITFIGSAPSSSFFAPEKLRRKKKRNWPDAMLSRSLLTGIARTLKAGLQLEFWLNSQRFGPRLGHGSAKHVNPFCGRCNSRLVSQTGLPKT